MWIVVTYDVATDTAEGCSRLRRVAQICKDYGQRVQKSVFECTVNEAQYERLKRRLLKHINVREDGLRFYRMQEPREKYVEEFGVGQVIDFKGPLVI